MEDERVRSLQEGDSRALELVIGEMGKKVYWLVRNILQDTEASREDVEDCVSEVFADVWRRRQELNIHRGSLETWVYMLAKYKALDWRRKKGQQVELVGVDEVELLSPEETDAQVLKKEQQKQLLQAVDTLKQKDRDIFFRRYFLYESIESIAESLQLTREAVDNRLWRARRHLREVLGASRKEGLL